MAVTNGTITKRILKAAKKMAPDAELKKEFIKHLNSFPMSSTKLVYDSDKGKMDPDVWNLLLEAAVETDKAKFEASERWFKSMGATRGGGLPYGRYNG